MINYKDKFHATVIDNSYVTIFRILSYDETTKLHETEIVYCRNLLEKWDTATEVEMLVDDYLSSIGKKLKALNPGSARAVEHFDIILES